MDAGAARREGESDGGAAGGVTAGLGPWQISFFVSRSGLHVPEASDLVGENCSFLPWLKPLVCWRRSLPLPVFQS